MRASGSSAFSRWNGSRWPSNSLAGLAAKSCANHATTVCHLKLAERFSPCWLAADVASEPDNAGGTTGFWGADGATTRVSDASVDPPGNQLPISGAQYQIATIMTKPSTELLAGLLATSRFSFLPRPCIFPGIAASRGRRYAVRSASSCIGCLCDRSNRNYPDYPQKLPTSSHSSVGWYPRRPPAVADRRATRGWATVRAAPRNRISVRNSLR